MGNLWLKIKIWTKVTIAGILSLYLLIFIIKNIGQNTTFWYWYNRSYQGSMLLLVLFAFLIGGLVTLLATTTFRTIRQSHERRARTRSAKLEREVAEMRGKAAMLQTKPTASSDAIPPLSAENLDDDSVPPT